MTELFEQVLGEFNAHMGTAYTSEAIELVPITRRNGVRKKNAVIERLHARNKSVSSPLVSCRIRRIRQKQIVLQTA